MAQNTIQGISRVIESAILKGESKIFSRQIPFWPNPQMRAGLTAIYKEKGVHLKFHDDGCGHRVIYLR